MYCPACQHETLANAKFCQECGSALAQSCHNCGYPLPDKAKFCPECAHPADGRGDFTEADSWLEKATAVSRQASARRYLAVNTLLLAACRRAQGNLVAARELVEEAFKLSKEIGIAFLGPSLFAAKASAAQDPAERQHWLRQGEAMLEGDCLAPGRLMFYRDAIEIFLEQRSWGEALRMADALEEFGRGEPVRFAELVAARTRGLVDLARRGPEPEIIEQLASVRDQIRRAGLGGLVLGIDAALASV